jgi:Ca2+-dependent lipid-binding protein
LKGANHDKTSDPYCLVESGSSKVKTAHLKRTVNPWWNETVHIASPSGDVKVSVLDYEQIGTPHYLGEFVVKAADLKPDTTLEQWFTLTGSETGITGRVHALLHVASKPAMPILIPKLVAKNAGQLVVKLISGKDLASCDPNGLSDPFVVVSVGEQSYKSEIVYRSLNPVWTDEEFYFETSPVDKELRLEVWDWDFIGMCACDAVSARRRVSRARRQERCDGRRNAAAQLTVRRQGD